MTAILLGALSAFLFGAMSVLVRVGLRSGVAPEAASLLTILPALALTAVSAFTRGDSSLASAWPFLLAGLLAPGISQVLFTFAVRDAGASRASVTVGTAPLFSIAIALVFLDEPLVAGLVLGAGLVVAGGILLASDRAQPEHFRRVGLVYALVATLAFAVRDSLIRWLGTEATEIDPASAAFATMLTGTAVVAASVVLGRARLTWRGAVAFLPAALCYGASYVLLFEAYYRGRVSVVSPIVATESLWAVVLSATFLRASEHVGARLVTGALCIVAGGALIGIFR